MVSRPIVLVGLLVVASLGGGGPAESQERPITTYVTVPTPSAEQIADMHEEMVMSHADAAWIIYLNPNGGTFDPGWPDESRENISSVLASVSGQTETVDPYPYGDASWQTVLDCVRDLYADFDVYVTDQDPGDTPHLETVVGGHPNDIGLPEGVGGIAPSGCEPVPNSVQYVFPRTYGAGGEQGICEAAGQETAHSFGLEHGYWCPDVMTYLWDCPDRKTFVDRDVDCGEYSPRNCSCSGSTQNSYQHLLRVIGPHPEIAPPTVSITSPDDGDTVGPGFGVTVDASDDGAIESVQLFVDGAHVQTANAPPYEFTAPDDLTAGEHEVEAHAFDDDGVEATDLITVIVSLEPGEECGPLEPCPVGQECVDGRCDGGGGDGIVGDADGGDGPGLDGDGQVGFQGGGCRVAPGGMPEAALLVLAIVALVLAARRRSR